MAHELDFKKYEKQITRKLKKKKIKCTCGCKDFTLFDNFLLLRAFDNFNARVNNKVADLVMLICKNCYEVKFFPVNLLIDVKKILLDYENQKKESEDNIKGKAAVIDDVRGMVGMKRDDILDTLYKPSTLFVEKKRKSIFDIMKNPYDIFSR